MRTILKFYSPSCAPCKALSTRLSQLGVKTQDIDVTEESVSILLHTYGVKAVPTLVKIEEGKPTTTMTGYSSQEELSKFLEA